MVLIDARMINKSGIGVYIREIVRGLVESGIVVRALVHRAGIPYLPDGVEYLVVSFGRFSPRNFLGLRQQLVSCDLFFVPNLAVLPVTSVPIVSTVHDLCPVALKHIFGVRKALVYWLLMLVQLVQSRRIVSISKFTEGEINKYFFGLFSNKIRVVWNGLSLKKSPAGIREHIRGLREINYALVVGNVKPHKNVAALVDAFQKSKLSESGKLVVVGEREGFRTSETVVFDQCKVVFTGFVTDSELDFIYMNAKVFLFPSLYEGFGLPLLEAMSYGLPIICSDIPVFRELAGNSVEYFNPGSMTCSLDRKRFSEFSKIDYSSVLSKYSWRESSKKLISVFGEAGENSAS